ncbi:MAG: signal peptidase II [Chloroflexota bacterium]|nr:signal peptidase II [Chloroflexota bacterium]
MRKGNLSGWLVILGTATIVVVLDQLTKRWIEGNLAIGESLAPFPELANFFTISHFTNTGAAFGLFRGQSILLAIIPVVVVVAIVVYIRQLPMNNILIQFSLGLQLGGAIGNNLFDRIRLGHVTDFIYFHFWPAFNIADIAIVSGTILLALVLLTMPEESDETDVVEGEAGEQRA